jgi:hypothetical protein
MRVLEQLSPQQSQKIWAPWLEDQILSGPYDRQGSRWLDCLLVQQEAQQGRQEVR